LIIRLRVDAKVENNVMYMPVAEAAAGWISICTKAELNIDPGPIPDKAAKNAAMKETIQSLRQLRTVSYWSPLVNW
jgi:hypothetical protein